MLVGWPGAAFPAVVFCVEQNVSGAPDTQDPRASMAPASLSVHLHSPQCGRHWLWRGLCPPLPEGSWAFFHPTAARSAVSSGGRIAWGPMAWVELRLTPSPDAANPGKEKHQGQKCEPQKGLCAGRPGVVQPLLRRFWKPEFIGVRQQGRLPGGGGL